MTQYESLSEKNKELIDAALKKVTYDMVKNLGYCEEIELMNSKVTLSHYCEDDVIVLNLTDDWIEIYQLQYDSEKKDVIFEAL